MPGLRERTLLVEGKDDQYAIVGLMAAHIAWGDQPIDWPVLIESADGVEHLLDSAFLSTYLKSSEARICGIVVDANSSLSGRWKQLKLCCQHYFPDMPDELPPSGMIWKGAFRRRLGVWLMPDNQSAGMLETLLCKLVPGESAPLWQHATAAADAAKEHAAPYKSEHIDKAHIHTFLAWQDPPGRPLGEALLAKMLDPHGDAAGPFVKWFRELYEL